MRLKRSRCLGFIFAAIIHGGHAYGGCQANVDVHAPMVHVSAGGCGKGNRIARYGYACGVHHHGDENGYVPLWHAYVDESVYRGKA